MIDPKLLPELNEVLADYDAPFRYEQFNTLMLSLLYPRAP